MPRIDLIKIRGGTAAEWTSANPVLDARERGYETDTRKSKHGDGSTAWNDLEYDTADTTATLEDVISNDEVATTKPVFQGGADFGADSGDVPAVITLKGGTGGTQNMVITSTTSGGAITQPTSFGVVSPEFNFTGGQARFGNYGSNTYTGTVASLAAFDSSGNIIETSASSGSDDQDASEVPFTPYLTITSTDTQAAIEELKDEVDALPSGGGGSSTQYLMRNLSDLVTDLTVGTSVDYFRMPFGGTLSDVSCSLLNAGTSTGVSIDILKDGVSILSTELTTDATEKTSTTATTAAVISDTSLPYDSEITFDITGVPTGGKGLMVTLEIEPV